MRNQRTMVNLSTSEAYQGIEMRRRIADCRERLRRNRASRRMSEHNTPHLNGRADEVSEAALVSVSSVEAEVET